MLPSDCGVYTGIQRHFVCQNFCIVSHILKWNSVLELHSYMKIAVLHDTDALEWHVERCEAWGDHALLSWAVARWVKAFRGWRVSTADMHYSGHLVSIRIDMSVTMIEQCMDKDRHRTVKALAEHRDFWIYIAALFTGTWKYTRLLPSGCNSILMRCNSVCTVWYVTLIWNMLLSWRGQQHVPDWIIVLWNGQGSVNWNSDVSP